MSKNITVHMREAFEEYVPNAGRWAETRGTGDIVTVDGNAVGASYLVISKSPFSAGSATSVTAVSDFEFPYELAIGAHMSQRTLGQEFSIEVIDTLPPLTAPDDVMIASISQATTTLTVDTAIPHGYTLGQSIGIYGVSDSRLNYPSLVVASVPTPTRFTVTAGPGGNIPSVTAGPFTTGYVYARSRLGYANNGVNYMFENASATQASLYVRSASGDVLPSGTVLGNHVVTLNTTASVQAINAAGTYAFTPTSEYRLFAQTDRIQWADSAVDAVAQMTSRLVRTQVVPDHGVPYRLRFRATNNKGLTTPVCHIQSVSKSGSTTATVVTQTPHNLTTGDQIATYGVRDFTNFANLTAATAVASVVDANTFTVVWGSAVTATSQSGIVYKVNGGNLPSALGAIAQVIQSVSRTANVLTLVGSASWSGFLVGDYVDIAALHTTTGSDLLLDGAYRVREIATTNLYLEPIINPSNGEVFSPTGPDIATTNCGGAVIKRTDMRVSFIRVFDYERERVEMLPRPANDMASAAPVTIQNSPAMTVSSGTITTVSTLSALTGGGVAEDAAAGANPVVVGGIIQTATAPTTLVAGDAVRDRAALSGAKIVKPYAPPETAFVASLALTTTTAAPIAAAAGASLKRNLTALQAINTGASAVDLIILDGATERWRMSLPINIPVAIQFPTELLVTANTALNANLSAVGTVRANFQGYTAP